MVFIKKLNKSNQVLHNKPDYTTTATTTITIISNLIKFYKNGSILDKNNEIYNYEKYTHSHEFLFKMKSNVKKYIYLILLVFSCVFLKNSSNNNNNNNHFSFFVVNAASLSLNAEFEHNELQTLQSNDNLTDHLNSNDFDIIFSDDRAYSNNKSVSNLDQETSEEVSYGAYKYPLPAKIVVVICAGTASIITVCGNLLVMCSFFWIDKLEIQRITLFCPCRLATL